MLENVQLSLIIAAASCSRHLPIPGNKLLQVLAAAGQRCPSPRRCTAPRPPLSDAIPSVRLPHKLISCSYGSRRPPPASGTRSARFPPAPAPLWRPASPADGNPTRGGDSPRKNGVASQGRLRPGREGLGDAGEAPSERRRKRLPPDPPKVDRNPASRGPSQPRPFKATAASAPHFVPPSPSLRHKTPTTQALRLVKPSPGIKFGVAAATTRQAERRGEGGCSSGPRPPPITATSPPNLPAAGAPAADPHSARAVGARFPGEWAPPAGVADLGSDPGLRGRDVGGRPGASGPGRPSPQKRGQHRGKVGLTSRGTMAAEGRVGLGVAPTPPVPGGATRGAERPATPCFPPPRGQDAGKEKGTKPPGTHKNAPRNLHPSPF